MIALVHGNPETAAVWDPLVAALGVPALRLSPPGFGAPVPAGWGATMTEYRDWLVAELEQVGEPVHLVGHDWGGVHVLGVAITRPDLLASWAADTVGVLDPEYGWHALARRWQTPGESEADVAAMTAGDVASRTAHLTALGIPADVVAVLAPGIDAPMGECILALYRSAAQPALVEAGRDLERAAARPGLAILPSADGGVGSMPVRLRSAARAGAQVAVLDGVGHWWPHEAPEAAAAALTRFWAVC